MPDPGTRNTRNAALLIAEALDDTFVKVSKTHGLSIANPTDYSEDTGHGQLFKSYLPGLSDFTVTLGKWYNTADQALSTLSLQRTPYFAMIYPDYADTTNYTLGQFFFTLSSLNLDLGNTADEGYDLRLAGNDPTIVVNGTPVTLA